MNTSQEPIARQLNNKFPKHIVHLTPTSDHNPEVYHPQYNKACTYHHTVKHCNSLLARIALVMATEDWTKYMPGGMSSTLLNDYLYSTQNNLRLWRIYIRFRTRYCDKKENTIIRFVISFISFTAL